MSCDRNLTRILVRDSYHIRISAVVIAARGHALLQVVSRWDWGKITMTEVALRKSWAGLAWAVWKGGSPAASLVDVSTARVRIPEDRV